MAIEFSSTGCRQAADSLNKSVVTLDSLLNGDLREIVRKVGEIYKSDSATQLIATFNKIIELYPQFTTSISNCSKYLSGTVAPYYEKIEAEAAKKLNNTNVAQ